jgi:hypothetical protein
MVSGLATQATSASCPLPSRLAISASVDRSGSESRSRPENVRAEDAILRGQVFALEEQALVYQACDVRQ